MRLGDAWRVNVHKVVCSGCGHDWPASLHLQPPQPSPVRLARSYNFPKEVKAGAFGDIETEDINAALWCINDWIDLPNPQD